MGDYLKRNLAMFTISINTKEEAGQVWSDYPKPYPVRQTGKAKNNSSQDVLSTFHVPGIIYTECFTFVNFFLTIYSEVYLPVCFYYYTIIFSPFPSRKKPRLRMVKWFAQDLPVTVLFPVTTLRALISVHALETVICMRSQFGGWTFFSYISERHSL